MREDTTSRDESAAAAHAQLLGAHEHIGSGVSDQDYNPALDKAAGADPWAGIKPQPVWWCMRCETPWFSGSPDEGCDSCGFIQEVAP